MPTFKFKNVKLKKLKVMKALSAQKQTPMNSLGHAFSYPNKIVGFMDRIKKGVKEHYTKYPRNTAESKAQKRGFRKQHTIMELDEMQEVESDYEEKKLLFVNRKCVSMKVLPSRRKTLTMADLSAMRQQVNDFDRAKMDKNGKPIDKKAKTMNLHPVTLLKAQSDKVIPKAMKSAINKKSSGNFFAHVPELETDVLGSK